MPTAIPTRGQPFNVYDAPRTDHGSPPHKPPPKPGFGNYCFRASANLSAEEKDIMEFVGYDQDFAIIKKVEKLCAIHERQGRGKCSDVKLAFLGDHPKCNGVIEVNKNLEA